MAEINNVNGTTIIGNGTIVVNDLLKVGTEIALDDGFCVEEMIEEITKGQEKYYDPMIKGSPESENSKLFEKEMKMKLIVGKGIQQNVIKSISFDQDEILQNIIKLYCPDGFDLDPTYSKGNYYKRVPKPKLFSDINPQVEDCFKADCRDLPFTDGTVGSINFDPPFLNTQPVKETEDNDLIHKRFGYIPANNMKDLLQFYYESLLEFKRILKPNGILVFKCQDMVSSGKQYLNHVEIINMAYSMGFYPIDLFILIAKNRMISGKHLNQQHSRKYHAYFLIFQKKPSPVRYMLNWKKDGEKQI